MATANSQLSVELRRRGRPSKLRTLLQYDRPAYDRMLALIRAGAFACVAAQSLGIAAETFSRWMTRGAKQQKGIFRQFRQDFDRAQAQARLIAEIQVYRENPAVWLRFGPGRTRPGMPGWTDHCCPNADYQQMPEASQTPVSSPSFDRQNSLATALLAFEEAGLATLLPAGREMLKVGLVDSDPPVDQ